MILLTSLFHARPCDLHTGLRDLHTEKERHIFILLPLRVKRCDLFILVEFILSISCHLA